MQETQEAPVQSLGGEDPLEVGMVTHSSILAWRIPWTEEPGGLHSMGSQRAGHDWVTEHVHRSTISGKVLTSSSSRKDCFVCFQDRCSLIVKISAS